MLAPLALILSLLLLPASASAQAPEPDTPIFRSDTSLALVRFQVVRKKQYVTDLQPGDIDLLEDGKPRKIALFEGGGAATSRRVPVELILLFDTSGSVIQPGLLDLLQIKASLLDTLPNVSLSVYRFEGKMRRLTGPTRDLEALKQAFAALDRRRVDFGKVFPLEQNAGPKDRKHGIGGSPIYEAVIEALRDAASGPGNTTRQMLVFSDGQPTTSTRPDVAAAVARETGIPVHPVALGHHKIAQELRDAAARNVDSQGRPKPPSDHLARLQSKEMEIQEFATLGELTGGRSFDPLQLSGESLRQICQYMVAQIRNEYVVGYYPGAEGRAAKHKIEVRLRSKDTGKLIGGTRTLASR